MFTVGETLEAREAKIQDFAKQDAVAGTILAAIHFEWVLRRCILAMGTTPTAEMRKPKVDKNDTRFSLASIIGGLSAYQRAWNAEVKPRIKVSLDQALADVERPASLASHRGQEKKDAQNKTQFGKVIRGKQCVAYAMNCRNRFVHGIQGTTELEHAQALVEIFLSAARALNTLATNQGATLFGARLCRKGPFAPKPQA